MSGNNNGSFGGAEVSDEQLTGILVLVFRVLPFIGWAGVVFLPFFFASGKDFAAVAIWQYVVAAVVGIGIAIGTKFIPFPPKLKWLSKVILWLPIAVVVLVIALALIF